MIINPRKAHRSFQSLPKTGLRVVTRNQSALVPKADQLKQPLLNKAVWTLGKIVVFQALLPMAAANLLGKVSWEAGLIGGVDVWLINRDFQAGVGCIRG